LSSVHIAAGILDILTEVIVVFLSSSIQLPREYLEQITAISFYFLSNSPASVGKSVQIAYLYNSDYEVVGLRASGGKYDCPPMISSYYIETNT
jgi:hypothetical protein